MNNINACAYREVYEILKLLPKELISKIPKEQLDIIKNNMDSNYECNITKDTFDGRNMLEETSAIIYIFFRDYWASEQEKKDMLDYQNILQQKEYEEAKIKYDVNNLFKQVENKEYTPVGEEQQLVTKKKTLNIKEFFQKIISIFKR